MAGGRGRRELRAALAAAGVAVDLRPGAELGHDMVGRLSQPELEPSPRARRTRAGCWWRRPSRRIGDAFHAATDELRDRGFAVLVAHPERSADAALDGCAGLRRELAPGHSRR